MRLFIHALGASAGGGLTYLHNLIPKLAGRSDVSSVVLAAEAERARIPRADRTEILDAATPGSRPLARFRWEQREIPKLVRQTKADILLSTGNFAVRNSPVPQILLSRNSLYTSADFLHDLRRRGEYRLWLDTKAKGYLARQSIRQASLTLAPSEAFARDLRHWSGRDVKALHHGFDRETFLREKRSLPPDVERKLVEAQGYPRLLFVSHYNYYRNFETLLHAVAILKQRLASGVRLLLTCELAPGREPGAYNTGEASALLNTLEIAEQVVQLGAIPYGQLHHLYAAADVYVTPAYTETFAHPLVEAMACGVPIVASDLATHREITDGAALFFEKFKPSELADRVVALLKGSSLRSDLRQRGLFRAQSFSWDDHADRLLAMAKELTTRP